MANEAGQLSLLDTCADEQTKPTPVTIGSEILRTSAVFLTYWRFAVERQQAFFARLRGEASTISNPILRKFKFTNAYRASDRVSQFLIRRVIYSGDQNIEQVFFRILLFKFFNKIETWKLLTDSFGELRAESFSVDRYSKVLNDALSSNQRIYSAAYIMPSGGRGTAVRKHVMHLNLLRTMLNDRVPDLLHQCKTMEQAFLLLRSYPTIGDFLAYQFVTDLNYSNIINFDEMDFVVPGPGARDGIRKCFPDASLKSASKIIRFMADQQDRYFGELDLAFPNLWGRRLQLVDCQNLFCEVDKYSRCAHPDIRGESGRTRIKQQFRPNLDQLHLFYPPKWGINASIPAEYR